MGRKGASVAPAETEMTPKRVRGDLSAQRVSRSAKVVPAEEEEEDDGVPRTREEEKVASRSLQMHGFVREEDEDDTSACSSKVASLRDGRGPSYRGGRRDTAAPRLDGSSSSSFLLEPRLSTEVFMKLFRIDREACPASIVESMGDIISRLPRRGYGPGEVIARQGDAKAKNELLIFVDGDVTVSSHVKFQQPSSGRDGLEETAATTTKANGVEETKNNETTSTGGGEGAGGLKEKAPAPDRSSRSGLRRSRRSMDSLDDDERQSEVLLALRAPFYIGEERVLRGSWPTATYVAGRRACHCYVLTERDIAALMLTGGFDLERTLRLRAFERTLAKHGMHVSVLRDAIFVDHFMAFLLRLYAAENLRFLVDLMSTSYFVNFLTYSPAEFKRDVDVGADFDVAEERFEELWDLYMRPWGAMSNVCAIECPPVVVDQITKARTDALKQQQTATLLSVFDPAARRVKKYLETDTLPDFVRSPGYPAFLRERFPEDNKTNGTANNGPRTATTKAIAKPAVATSSTASLKRHQRHTSGCDAAADSSDIDSRIYDPGLATRRPRRPGDQPQEGRFKSAAGLSARPSLQLKLANMTDELNDIERSAS